MIQPGFIVNNFPRLREVHARGVKISRGLPWGEKYFCNFVGIPAGNPVGIGSAKESSEIRLTERAVLVDFANCPRNKK
jgi:hypothetical protein